MFAPGITQDIIDKAIAFHGHWCPGLARGIRAAVWAAEHFGTAADEEIVTVTETDMCGVDAIQALLGCTFGKENCYYLAESPKKKSPCEGCCYGPCVSFCMKKILGFKGEEVPACVR